MGRARGQEGSALLGQPGFNPGLGIKGRGSARLVCERASTSVSFSCRVSPGSTETIIGSFSLEGSGGDDGVHQRNSFCNTHT